MMDSWHPADRSVNWKMLVVSRDLVIHHQDRHSDLWRNASLWTLWLQSNNTLRNIIQLTVFLPGFFRYSPGRRRKRLGFLSLIPSVFGFD